MINGKNIIAVCTSRIFDHEHHCCIEQLNEYLKTRNCAVMVFALNCDLYWENQMNAPEGYVFDIIPYDKIDCFVIMDEKIKSRSASEKIIANAAKLSIPVIVVDGQYENTTEVSFDYEKGFEGVVRHVIEHHSVRKPHFIAGIKDNKFSEARLEIFKKVLAENGIPFDDSMVSYGEFWSLPARNATQKLIDSGNIPEAVICANDIMAVNVCDVFIKAGIKVPEHVIVTGFDGIEEALLSTPQLTTAGCDSTELAVTIGGCVIDLINGKPRGKATITPKLWANASCGCESAPTASNTKMNGINNKFYRYQDDVRILYDISTKIQMSPTPEKAAACIQHAITHDMCCVVDSECLESSRNYFSAEETGSERCMFYDSYDPENSCYPLKPDEFVPDIEKRIESGYPIIFNALDFMSKPFGYICYSYLTYDINEYTRTASITNTISMGIGGYVNMNHQRYLTDKITEDLKNAAHMQENMLPAGFVKHSSYQINASMIPAKNVGGDFYDYFQPDSDHLVLIMADVSGKGVPAALFMAISKLVIHDRAQLPGTPAEILRDVNRHISDNNQMGLFITIWFGILDLKTGIITYATAGHEYPAVMQRNGNYELLRSENMPPVGALDDMIYEDLTIDLSGGGSLFIYTDGVTDLKNEQGEHFGTDRMTDLLNKLRGRSSAEVISGMTAGLAEFAGETERFDDTTMLCLNFDGV